MVTGNEVSRGGGYRDPRRISAAGNSKPLSKITRKLLILCKARAAIFILAGEVLPHNATVTIFWLQ